MSHASRTTARAVIGLVVAFELIALAYGVLTAWLMSAWVLHESEAIRMQSRDWWIIAGRRFAVVAILASTAAAIVFFLNRRLVRALEMPASRVPRVMTRLFAVLPVTASLAGAIQFALTKPSF